LEDFLYEKIHCIRCNADIGYMHDPSGGEYGFDFVCYKCAKIIHYKKMGMFE